MITKPSQLSCDCINERGPCSHEQETAALAALFEKVYEYGVKTVDGTSHPFGPLKAPKGYETAFLPYHVRRVRAYVAPESTSYLLYVGEPYWVTRFDALVAPR